MARRISMETRKELIGAVAHRNRTAPKGAKSKIPDEFETLASCHRKHAIRVLNGAPHDSLQKVSRNRLYDGAVRQVLIILWEAADRLCGKRLKALIPMLVDAMQRHGHLSFDAVIKATLLKMSAATIDRALRPTRERIDAAA